MCVDFFFWCSRNSGLGGLSTSGSACSPVCLVLLLSGTMAVGLGDWWLSQDRAGERREACKTVAQGSVNISVVLLALSCEYLAWLPWGS